MTPKKDPDVHAVSSDSNSRSAGTAVRSLGLCLGASTISTVLLETHPDPPSGPSPSTRILNTACHPHEGNPKATLQKALEELPLETVDRIAATGRRFRHFVNLSSLPEPEAVERAYRHVKPPDVHCPAIVSAGGETFMVYLLDGNGQISTVRTGNKCASGTGEFFLQQLRRMDVPLEEAARWAATETPHHVSGRCSVFCKSDCTHATNKGVPKSRVTAGLCRMMADKIIELLKKVERRNIMLVGGTARNQMMVRYLEQAIENLVVPDAAPVFEALGAGLWAMDHETQPFPGMEDLFRRDQSSFDRLPPLEIARPSVVFKTMETDRVRSGDVCILGLDVGSTTTKAVLMRTADKAMLASVYLRTNGDPVGASRRCYRDILGQIEAYLDPGEVSIVGLGVCGSGRQIAGLHALTDGVINEIIAHCCASVFFDPEVDTIFEIGGQDAKYTYVTNAVPSDYAMNEACSAGTGSFLEESAYETLGIAMEDIAEAALQGSSPPNFNDQCAAFISSDIKNAIHEGIEHADIVAGLVYSICMNYTNRVKGNRPVGEKIFMQGGVCYNHAVPLAMATLVGKPIVVPPEPGLMGAFGVALEVQKRIASGLMQKGSYDLRDLADREVRYGKTFTCAGGKERCDRRCEITMIEVDGQRHPFGGACNRYYNIRQKLNFDIQQLELVRRRQALVFDTYGVAPVDPKTPKQRERIAIHRSFLVNTYYPLYATFFSRLGMDIVLAEEPSTRGIDSRGAAFCYPVELSHGFFFPLTQMDPAPDYLFLPHFKAVPSQNGSTRSEVCPLVQAEPYYLQTAFAEPLAALQKGGMRLLTPLLDLTSGLSAAEEPLVQAAVQIGKRPAAARRAFREAARRQRECFDEMQRLGREAMQELEEDPDRMAVVLFGRPYNAFAGEAHMGIPRKFASRGVKLIPLDFLPLEGENTKRHMYWGMGQIIMQAARFVARHPQLFGTYITNFSCGPDSFVIGYFRNIMGQKPSLTLELDSHTADAGLETRIEAFLDVVTAYRSLTADATSDPPAGEHPFCPARAILRDGVPMVVDSSGNELPMKDPRVTVLFPSMGRTGSEAIAALFRGAGFNAVAHPPSDEAVLKQGRGNTSCKECLPLILTTGTLLNYIRNEKRPDEILVYFMATGSGPCRFGQYMIFMEDLVRKLELPDVTLLSLSSDNGYAGMGKDFHKMGWWAIVVSDLMEDVRAMLLANAADRRSALETFEMLWGQVLEELERQGSLSKGDFEGLERRLADVAERLRQIPLRQPADRVPRISLVGEIFVRRDGLSRQFLTERLAERGFATVCAPVSEWMNYADWLVERGLAAERMSLLQKWGHKLKRRFMARYESRLRNLLARSGLVHADTAPVEQLIESASPFISPNHTGEAILTVGSALTEIASQACGVIAIGPFGCMPNRIAEAVLGEIMVRETKLAADGDDPCLRDVLENVESLPFLAIESDGSTFPQVITAKLEAFCLHAERLHGKMLSCRESLHG
ncbi:MAG: acyl-CoA dehydratase activase [Desulfobacteraceae bacterium]|nr:acyl-CoA dehydratase activase [Desulfobacteraceae bacterium]